MFPKTSDSKSNEILEKPVRGFLLSVAFGGLVFLAFNPFVVIQIQETLGFSDAEKTPETREPEPTLEVSNTPLQDTLPDLETPTRPKIDDSPVIRRPTLPTTTLPNEDNLPRIDGFEDITKNDLWVGDMSCGEDIFDLPATLRGVGPQREGQIFTELMTSVNPEDIRNQPTYIYESENGVIMRVIKPVVKYYDASGRRFRDVHKDIIERKPLDVPPSFMSDPDALESEKETATLANISSPTLLSFTSYGSRDYFRLLKGKTILTSAFIITLPRWTTYDIASPADQAKWDDLMCNAAHHELGHLRIRLDILAETLDGYAALPSAGSSQALEELTKAYRADINARINARQEAYHIYNGGGLRRGMTELPYAQLPLPWLEPAKTNSDQLAD